MSHDSVVRTQARCLIHISDLHFGSCVAPVTQLNLSGPLFSRIQKEYS